MPVFGMNNSTPLGRQRRRRHRRRRRRRRRRHAYVHNAVGSAEQTSPIAGASVAHLKQAQSTDPSARYILNYVCVGSFVPRRSLPRPSAVRRPRAPTKERLNSH